MHLVTDASLAATLYPASGDPAPAPAHEPARAGSLASALYPSSQPAVAEANTKTPPAAEPAQRTAEQQPGTADAGNDQADPWDPRADKEWPDAIAADPEIGGVNQPAAVAAARSVVLRYATPELIAELTASGYGNHPGLVKFLARIGKALQ